jgi:hypothetical protein
VVVVETAFQDWLGVAAVEIRRMELQGLWVLPEAVVMV